MVCTLQAQMWSVSFLETGFTEQIFSLLFGIQQLTVIYKQNWYK
jgi:hypothetical protein